MSDDIITTQKEQIVKLLKEKAATKQDVHRNTVEVFAMVKEVVNEIAEDLKKEIDGLDRQITVASIDLNAQSIQLKVAGDILEFYMHTNVFEFDHSHPMFKTGYIRQNEQNSFCGIINIYNFLSDSFKYNRVNDIGYLTARIFVNREKHFFIESRPSSGYKYTTFSESPVTKDNLKEIINEQIIFAVTYDLFTPPFDAIRQVTVMEMQEKVNSVSLRTGKRLGYSSPSAATDEEVNY